MATGRQGNTKKSSTGAKANSTVKKGSTAKNTTKNSSTAKSKSKSSAGSKGKKTSGKATTKRNQLQDEITVLIAFAFAIILILSNFNLAGSIGHGIKWFMFGVFGVAEYIFPVIVAFSLIFLISNREIMAVAKVKTVAVYVLTVLLAAAWQRITDNPVVSDTSVGEFFTYCAENKTGGGLFGGAICKLLSPLGFLGSMVIILIFAIICIIVITEKSFINGVLNVSQKGSDMVHAAKQDYDTYMEHAQAKREAKQEEKALARMDRKALGVTNDREIKREEVLEDNIDVREIVVEVGRDDEYSDDIYEPLNADAAVSRVHKSNRSSESDISNEQWAAAQETAQQMAEQSSYEENAAYEENEAYTGGRFESQHNLTEQSMQEYEQPVQYEQASSQSVEDAGSINMDTEVKHKEYVFPPITLLNKGKGATSGNSRENRDTAMRLQQTLQNFGVKVTITDISCGPSVTRYELQPEQGVKVSKIVSLADDIKLNLAAADIRIEAPIPGKAAIGIEVPNKEAGSVFLRDLLESDTFVNNPSAIAFGAGKDIAGKTIVADIAKMPHLLIAGATGSGKSVCINTIIMSILYKANPDDVKMLMVDPKVVELSVYNGIPHLLTPVVTEPKKATAALNWAVAEMDSRYKQFAKYNVRDLKGFNAKIEKLEVAEGEEKPEKMPQIVIIIDELADLMMVASGEVEEAICRLAQLARAAGIHLVIATQRPSVNVITGLIKANVPSRIAFSVSSGVDSRTIIDMNGAEKLLGKGDMLFFPSGYPKPVRVQGAFVSDEEVGRVVDFLKENVTEEIKYNEEVTTTALSEQIQKARVQEEERDPYFADAGRFVIEKEKGSIGMLQRYYKIGFNRAGRIMDQLAEARVVGPELGTKPRKIEMTMEEFEAYLREHGIE